MDAHEKSVYIIDTHWHKMCSHKGHTDTKCVHIRDTQIQKMLTLLGHTYLGTRRHCKFGYEFDYLISNKL